MAEEKKQYVILKESTPGILEDSINIYSDKGYELTDFVVDSPPLQLYIAVMKRIKPTRFHLDAKTG